MEESKAPQRAAAAFDSDAWFNESVHSEFPGIPRLTGDDGFLNRTDVAEELVSLFHAAVSAAGGSLSADTAASLKALLHGLQWLAIRAYRETLKKGQQLEETTYSKGASIHKSLENWKQLSIIDFFRPLNPADCMAKETCLLLAERMETIAESAPEGASFHSFARVLSVYMRCLHSMVVVYSLCSLSPSFRSSDIVEQKVPDGTDQAGANAETLEFGQKFPNIKRFVDSAAASLTWSKLGACFVDDLRVVNDYSIDTAISELKQLKHLFRSKEKTSLLSLQRIASGCWCGPITVPQTLVVRFYYRSVAQQLKLNAPELAKLSPDELLFHFLPEDFDLPLPDELQKATIAAVLADHSRESGRYELFKCCLSVVKSLVVEVPIEFEETDKVFSKANSDTTWIEFVSRLCGVVLTNPPRWSSVESAVSVDAMLQDVLSSSGLLQVFLQLASETKEGGKDTPPSAQWARNSDEYPVSQLEAFPSWIQGRQVDLMPFRQYLVRHSHFQPLFLLICGLSSATQANLQVALPLFKLSQLLASQPSSGSDALRKTSFDIMNCVEVADKEWVGSLLERKTAAAGDVSM